MQERVSGAAAAKKILGVNEEVSMEDVEVRTLIEERKILPKVRNNA